MKDGSNEVPVWTRNEVQSPCINVCVIHPEERLCTGCLRSIDEIAQWSRISNDERETILEELPGRAPRLRKRRGGRNARLKRGGEEFAPVKPTDAPD